ncbi:hypothetical protein EPA93_40305 [Ktedonosporobacter rubrisoli]|uniref:Uncharacterized protein n=1 Tax=Ktedonosporobacter rubrisoli TaxID=2509675 RepID=A0A4P6K1D8_KTERU|nr:hypothetical protein [Ktedonosporobacter rubrisoli]QBD81889.1 hypothetical protein EPA93_40305 [Ktedonosporobacter rubrisoli]
MIIKLYGFDWMAYCERVMPALARWIIEGDEGQAHELYQQTRCAQEERFVPYIMAHLSSWPRAQKFVRQLPRGQQALNTYRHLCSAEHFTALSDRYIQRHPPQLHYNEEALLTVWGAIVTDYCLRPLASPQQLDQAQQGASKEANLSPANTMEISIESTAQSLSQATTQSVEQESGISIGRHPMQLHMRGWLATCSVRAMALFELLACGRRCMPFGYQAGSPFGSYIGYLTANELEQLASCLRGLQAPDKAQAELDNALFHREISSQEPAKATRIIDEVTPMYAAAFLQAISFAAPQKYGLICMIG